MKTLFDKDDRQDSHDRQGSGVRAGASNADVGSDHDSYTAAQIEVLEGLEPVRRRPGMYIGGTDEQSLHHLFSEVLDNAVDEAIAGHATRIDVALNDDGGIVVADNGRGIPVDRHPKFPDKTALEVIMTTLHAGGKFGSDTYTTSGGLHGVGISIVNALSSKLVVEIARDRKLYRQTFSRGIPTSPFELIADTRNRRGTRILFFHDPDIFGENSRFDPKRLFRVTRSKAYLRAGLEIHWKCAPAFCKQNPDIPEEASFRFPNGLQDFLLAEIGGRETVPGIFAHTAIHSETSESVEWAIAWLANDNGFTLSYCNTIPTPGGGTHETSARSVLLNGLRNYGMLIGEKRAAVITSEDLASCAAIMLSIFIRDPEFQGQTKEKLTNRSVHRVVESAMRDPFDHWLLNHPAQSRQLLEHLITHAEDRIQRRREKSVVRKSPTRKLRLPGKLTDCSRQEATGTEIFVVEGDSAGGSAKLARNRLTQAILPLRGKILNVANAAGEKIENNQQLSDLILALGCGTRSSYFEKDLRYEKVIIMTDADVDGAHVASLLLTFFFREMPQLIQNKHLYLAAPPLYRLTQGGETCYACDDMEKETRLAELSKKKGRIDIGRFKGLGEMTASQLKETTMDPDKRMLLRVEISEDHVEETRCCVERLMGSKVEPRFLFIQDRACFANDEGLDL